MASASNPKPSRAKVQAHCERLRAQGLRPIQIDPAGLSCTDEQVPGPWLPDGSG